MSSADAQNVLFGIIVVIVICYFLYHAIAKEAHLQQLRRRGENIPATVRKVEGRHLETHQLLHFVGMRKSAHKQYRPGDPIWVLVDLKNPGDYAIQWEYEPIRSNSTRAQWRQDPWKREQGKVKPNTTLLVKKGSLKNRRNNKRRW